MRSKRVFAAQRAAREKEKRKTAKSAVKTENSKKFGGQLFKIPRSMFLYRNIGQKLTKLVARGKSMHL